MDANQGPAHRFLTPFIANLDLEESLVSALPSSCMKTRDNRGGFDDLVLSELERAMVGRIATLEKNVADAAAAISERKATIASAEATIEAKKLAEQNAAADLEAATTAHCEAEAQVAKASEDWTTFEPRVQEAAENHKLHDTKRIEFADGPLKSFETLRESEVAYAYGMPSEQQAAALAAGA